MKYLSVIAICTFVFACGSRDFAEFDISDVSEYNEFKDFKSASYGHHDTMTFDILGELDSSAVVSFFSYPDMHFINEIQLKKGRIEIRNVYTDYYEGDTLLIKYLPMGCEKGNLKIRTRIN